MTNFWEYSEKFTPILVRLLARHPHGAPLSAHEIAIKGGLEPYQVEAISWNTSWSGIDLPTMRKFLTGCRIDFCNQTQMRRVYWYFRKRPTWKYLRTSPNWLTIYYPMIKRWRESIAKPTPTP